MQANSNGARLAYVVVKLDVTVQREITTWKKKEGIVKRLVEEPGGYMVYFPRGHVLRFKTMDDLRRYGLDKRPPIINLNGLNDPNSPIGQMLMSQDEDTRRGAFESMEKMVIQLATAKSGKVQMPEQLEVEAA